MIQSVLTDYYSDEKHTCPTCWEQFGTSRGMKLHHYRKHGESIAGVNAVCGACGVIFPIEPGRAEKYSTHHCSDECKGEAYSKLTADQHPRWSKVTVECATCGNELQRSPSRVRNHNRQFCGMECRNEGFQGSGHPQWRNGGGEIYHALLACLPGSWKDVRQHAQEKEGHECYMCGESPNQTLDVHHIIPLLVGGVHEEPLLMPLCDSCHATVEDFTRRLFDPILVG